MYPQVLMDSLVLCAYYQNKPRMLFIQIWANKNIVTVPNGDYINGTLSFPLFVGVTDHGIKGQYAITYLIEAERRIYASVI